MGCPTTAIIVETPGPLDDPGRQSRRRGDHRTPNSTLKPGHCAPVAGSFRLMAERHGNYHGDSSETEP